MIAQPIYPLMVHRLQQAKVAVAASSLIVGQAGKKTSRKRKLRAIQKLLEDLSNREKEYNSKIEEFRREKMERMDKFLDLFEKKA